MLNEVKSCFTCNVTDCSIFKKSNLEFLKLIDGKKTCTKYGKNQPIIFEGSQIDGVYMINSGVAKVHIKGYKGRPLILRLIKQGDISGHIPDTQNRQPVSITAVEETGVCFIENYDFEAMLSKSATAQKELMTAIKEELKEVEIRAIQLAQMNVREKIAGTILHILDTYLPDKSGKQVHINLSRQDIADLSGTTKEQVSKTFSDFGKENLIAVKGKSIRIIEYKKLENIAGLAQVSFLAS